MTEKKSAQMLLLDALKEFALKGDPTRTALEQEVANLFYACFPGYAPDFIRGSKAIIGDLELTLVKSGKTAEFRTYYTEGRKTKHIVVKDLYSLGKALILSKI